MSSFVFLAVLSAIIPSQADAELYQDFRGKQLPHPPLRLVGPQLDERVRPEAEGLRVTMAGNRSSPAGVGVMIDRPLSGDFEITASYEVLSADQPTQGFGVGVNMTISPSPAQEKLANVARFWLPGERNGHLARFTIKGPGGVYKSHLVETDNRTGRFRLKRQGATLEYLVAEGLEGDFQKIYEHEYGVDDIGL